jgi:hypothetical protein
VPVENEHVNEASERRGASSAVPLPAQEFLKVGVAAANPGQQPWFSPPK